jgi:hypothetical protein
MSEDTFDPQRLVKNDDIREVNVEGIGVIKYRPLLAVDMLALRRVLAENDDFEMFGLKATWTMLNKVYPEFTFEQFMKYSPRDSGAIITAILKDADFLESSSEGL